MILTCVIVHCPITSLNSSNQTSGKPDVYVVLEQHDINEVGINNAKIHFMLKWHQKIFGVLPIAIVAMGYSNSTAERFIPTCLLISDFV